MSGSQSHHTYHVRMILLGEAGAGKSCLFHRIKYKAFRDSSDPQTADLPNSTHTKQLYDSYTTKIRLSGDNKVSFAVYDTAGRERFQSMTAQYYRHINLVLLVCSADSEVTLTKLSKWHAEAKNYIDDARVTYALCVTKCDLPEKDREITRAEIDSFAQHCGIPQKHIFEISAKSGDKVSHMIKALCNAVIQSYQNDKSEDTVMDEASEVSSLMLSISSVGGTNVTRQPKTRTCCCVIL